MKSPYSELINDILRFGERRIFGMNDAPAPIEVTVDEHGRFIGAPLFYYDGVNNPEGFKQVVQDVMINLKINPNFLNPCDSKIISFEFHKIGKRVSITFHKGSVMLTSGIEEVNAITEVPYILACASLFACIYYWKTPQMLELTDNGQYVYAFGFKFVSPYIRIPDLPLLEKMEKTDVEGEKADELFILRIASEREDASNFTVDDFWIDKMENWKISKEIKVWNCISPRFFYNL